MDVSDTFTRNPEVVNAAQLRPSNTGLANVLVANPQMAITGDRAPQIRPSNPAAVNLLASNSNMPVGSGDASQTDRDPNENLGEGGGLYDNVKGVIKFLKHRRMVKRLMKEGIVNL